MSEIKAYTRGNGKGLYSKGHKDAPRDYGTDVLGKIRAQVVVDVGDDKKLISDVHEGWALGVLSGAGLLTAEQAARVEALATLLLRGRDPEEILTKIEGKAAALVGVLSGG